MRPMLATRGSHVPTGPEWSHEIKWDGMRILADIRRGEGNGDRSGVRQGVRQGVRLTSRNENDVSVSYPELARPAGPRRAARR